MNRGNFPRPLKIAAINQIHDAWNESRDANRIGGAAGVDGIKPHKFREHLDRNLKAIHRQLIAQEYEFSKLRPIAIPKEGRSPRIICVPTVSDRLVQRLVVRYLNREQDILGIRNSVSYGFIQGRGGVPKAVKRVKNLRANYPWVFKSDIASFFDKIDREILKDELARRLGKSSIIPNLYQAIDCEISQDIDKSTANDISRTNIKEGRGLRQGMPLSPILSNFVLREFDKFFENQGSKLIRYADDFVLLAKNPKECDVLLLQTKELLRKKNHTIPQPGRGSKTIIRRPDEPFEFLGFEIIPKFKGSGYQICVPQKAFGSIKDKLTYYSDIDRMISEHETFSNVVSKIDFTTNGFVNVYKPAVNFADLRSHASNCRKHTLGKLLSGIF